MPSPPPEFRQIRLELAREPGHPEGSRATGYDLVAPLDGNQRLSAEIWRTHKEQCRVHRFREGEDDMVGRLARKPGGAWYFDYDDSDADDDENAYHLGDERFVIGEYVSIRDEHGHMHTYRVMSVRSL
jgi:hypothetical protein